LDEQHKKHPTHPVIVSEYGAGSDKRIHSLKPKSFDFSIEYQQKYLEHYLPVMEERDFIAGSTHWNFIDFSSALRDESMPRINNKGLVYADRTPRTFTITSKHCSVKMHLCYILHRVTGNIVPDCKPETILW
ncbi:hypothetical protein LJC05_04550, partial [Bacteroides sp. OttesenSCG-928-J23]|nr:hypothetical protein [Bacteroides sp. OttesenSCG-928-J23]